MMKLFVWEKKKSNIQPAFVIFAYVCLNFNSIVLFRMHNSNNNFTKI